MSTILEALRKARREREARLHGAPQAKEAPALGLEERPDEQKIAAERQRAQRFVRRLTVAAITSACILFALLGVVALLIHRSQTRSQEAALPVQAGRTLAAVTPAPLVPTTREPSPPPAPPKEIAVAPKQDYSANELIDSRARRVEARMLEAKIREAKESAPAPKPRIERPDLPPTYLKIAEREAESPIRETVTLKTPKKEPAEEESAAEPTEAPAKQKKKTTPPEEQAEQAEKTLPTSAGEAAQEAALTLKELPDGALIDAKDIGFNLEGIVWDKQKPLAMINNQIIAEGEEVGGYLVTKIHKNSIEVKKGTRTFTLKY
jgi:hypothetical protein